jgi:HSP20 family protein
LYEKNEDERIQEDETMTTLVRWNTGRWAPFREVAVMQNELSRLMNGLFEANAGPAQAWVPTLDAWETADEMVCAFDLPGVPQEAISIEVEDGALTVSAERTRSAEVSEESYQRLERRYGKFSRTVGLPQGVAEDGVTASYADGVLQIHVRKPDEPKPRKIEIAITPATIDAGTPTPGPEKH